MFFMLILSYCCCLILSGYFYSSKQDSEVARSPSPRSNRLCLRPYAFSVPQVGLVMFQLPAGNDV